MGGLKFSIEAIKAHEAQERLARVRDRVAGGLGPDAAGPVVLAELSAINEERFDTEGFGQWPPLSETTQRLRWTAMQYRWYGAHHYANPPLGWGEISPMVWTGALLYAMSDPLGAGQGDSVVSMRPEALELGTRLPYPRSVFFGARNVTTLNPEHRRRLTDAFQRYVDDAVED